MLGIEWFGKIRAHALRGKQGPINGFYAVQGVFYNQRAEAVALYILGNCTFVGVQGSPFKTVKNRPHTIYGYTAAAHLDMRKHQPVNFGFAKAMQLFKRRAQIALTLVGLAERASHRPNELSGGQQQRVAIARALVSDPTLIVADEPTGDLDRDSANDVLKLLQRLNDEVGKTIVMVTHDQRAAEAAHAIMHLEKGELSAREVVRPR